MSNSIKVEVRQDHIDDGVIENGTCCAIALACEDFLLKNDKWKQEYEMHVEMDGCIGVKDKSDNTSVYQIDLTENTQWMISSFIDKFDNQNEYYHNQKELDENLQPFEFEGELKWLK